MSRDSRSNVSICSIKVPPALPLGLGDVQTSLHLRRSFEYAEEYYICRDFCQWHHHLKHKLWVLPRRWSDTPPLRRETTCSHRRGKILGGCFHSALCVSWLMLPIVFFFFKVLWRWLLMSVKHPFYFRHSTRMSLKDADGLLRGTWTQIMYLYDNSEANIILFTPLQFLTAIVISCLFFFQTFPIQCKPCTVSPNWGEIWIWMKYSSKEWEHDPPYL